MSKETLSESIGAPLTVDFIRHRNALLVRGDLSALFVDYYLHLAEHGLRYDGAQSHLFHDSLAAFALHCASRPHGEHVAWSMNLQSPHVNVFLTGDNEDYTVAGRLFTENVRDQKHHVFYSEVMARRGAEKRRSVVPFDTADAFRAAEAFYSTSEQRTARFFDLGEDQYAMLISHPDCDEAWLREIDLETVRGLAEKETLAPVERRVCRWNCGCNQAKILDVLTAPAREDLDALFGDDSTIRVQCPRCAANHAITREVMAVHLAQADKSK